MNKIQRDKKVLLAIMTILFSIILIISFRINSLDDLLLSIQSDLEEVQTNVQSQLIEETILGQAQRTATSLREGFRYFFKAHPYLDIRELDNQGRVIYRNLKGEKLAFNSQKMSLKSKEDFFYDIYAKNGELLLEKARPIWNKKLIKEILKMTSISNMKMYGSTGDPLIFDPHTGEVILNNSKDSAPTAEVLNFADNGSILFRNINLDPKHPNAGYPEAMQWVLNHQLTWRRDGAQVYYFGMKNQAIPLEDVKKMESMNFSKYPLGGYNREFQYQFVIPSETLGLQDTDMQLIVVLSAQEREIIQPYLKVVKKYKAINKQINYLKQSLIYIPKAITILAIIITTLSIFGLRTICLHALQKG